MLTKTDILGEELAAEELSELVESLTWTGPVYAVSSHSGDGTKTLMRDIYEHLKTMDADEIEGDDEAVG